MRRTRQKRVAGMDSRGSQISSEIRPRHFAVGKLGGCGAPPYSVSWSHGTGPLRYCAALRRCFQFLGRYHRRADAAPSRARGQKSKKEAKRQHNNRNEAIRVGFHGPARGPIAIDCLWLSPATFGGQRQPTCAAVACEPRICVSCAALGFHLGSLNRWGASDRGTGTPCSRRVLVPSLFGASPQSFFWGRLEAPAGDRHWTTSSGPPSQRGRVPDRPARSPTPEPAPASAARG